MTTYVRRSNARKTTSFRGKGLLRLGYEMKGVVCAFLYPLINQVALGCTNGIVIRVFETGLSWDLAVNG